MREQTGFCGSSGRSSGPAGKGVKGVEASAECVAEVLVRGEGLDQVVEVDGWEGF